MSKSLLFLHFNFHIVYGHGKDKTEVSWVSGELKLEGRGWWNSKGYVIRTLPSKNWNILRGNVLRWEHSLLKRKACVRVFIFIKIPFIPCFLFHFIMKWCEDKDHSACTIAMLPIYSVYIIKTITIENEKQMHF